MIPLSHFRLAGVALLALAGVLAAPAAAQTTLGTWGQAAPLPVVQSEWDGVTIGDSLFIVGGEQKRMPQTDATKASDELWIYDAKGDRWIQGAVMPGGRNHPAVAALGGKLYVFGGYNFPCCANYPWPYGSDNAWEYNPKTNTWRTLAPVPRKIGAGMAAAFDGKIYVMAGTDSGAFHSVATVHEYDPVANSWRARASMRNAREHVKGAVVDSLIYIIGGHSLQGTTKVNQAAVEAYSPRSDKWYDKGTMPSPRGGTGVAYLGGKLYVFGGEAANFSVVTRVDQLDPLTGTWAKVNDIPSTSGIHAHATMVWNGRAHLVAGSNPGGFQPKNSHAYYTPAEVLGCTQPAAPNFNRYATKDDGSCQPVSVLRRGGAGDLRILAGGHQLRIEGLAPGNYRLYVLDPLGRAIAEGIQADGQPALSLPAGSGARFLRVEGAEGAAVKGAALPR